MNEFPVNIANENQPAEDCVKNNQKKITVAMQLGASALFQPLKCARILMQLGYEPLPLEQGKTWLMFGRRAFFLPNIFKYIKNLKRSYGLSALYTGVGTTFCHDLCALCVSLSAMEYLEEKYPTPDVDGQLVDTETAGQEYSRFVTGLTKETIAKAAGIIVARPFQVILIRRVAQIIGNETIYMNTVGSFFTIYDDEGIRGLFCGLIPQVFGELAVLWLTKTIIFLLRRHWKQQLDLPDSVEDNVQTSKDPVRTFMTVVENLVPTLVRGFFYPFELVSVVMSVNGTKLAVGGTASVPIFIHWQDCWDYLARQNQLKRGAKVIMRHYAGGVDFRAGHIYAKTPRLDNVPIHNLVFGK